MKRFILCLLTIAMFLPLLCVPANAAMSDAIVESVAQTFVSKNHPDTAMGNSNNMVISGGDDANVYFISFRTADLADLGYAELDVTVKNDGAMALSVYLLDDYRVNTETLTYNTMPDLTTAHKLPIGSCLPFAPSEKPQALPSAWRQSKAVA